MFIILMKLRKTLKKARKINLNWEITNSVMYDINKTEAILFSKARYQKLNNQLIKIQLIFEKKTIYFNKKAIR